MSLEVGSRIAHYDVTALIGEGGMGQVYQATDTKLKRQVALKILPEAFATDPDRLARFQREAQVLASLNHPGIAAIYGIEEEGGTRALVLELVEGPTLADRIAKGPIPLDEALPIAKQIAEALEAAHEAGVIHRDLKPANIKVRDDGTVKVLDFGLAKALDTTPHGDPSQSPTLTAAATQMGVIMGTAAYMSPEQARGRPVDRRADIWAFGCVLYEMLTGQRAFPGADVSDTLVAVITADVDLDALPTATPARIRHVLKACLQKETKDRVHDIGDVGLAMTGVFETAVSNVPAGAARPARRWSTLPLAVGASASALVFAGVSFWTADRPAAPPVSRFVVSAPVLPGSAPDLISPDGRTIVFGNAAGGIVGQEQMFVRRLDEVEAVPLLGAQGTVPKAFTPDGQELLFTDGSVLKSVPLTGGSATTLVEASFGVGIISTPEGMVWGSPTGLWLGSPSGPQLLAGPAEGESGNYYQPRTLPDGRGVLFHIWNVPPDDPQVAVYDFRTGEHRILVPGTSPRFAASGHLVFHRAGSLWALPFDVERLAVEGAPHLVVEGVGVNVIGTAFYSLADDGTLVYRAVGAAGSVGTLVWVDRTGREEPLGAEWPPADYSYPRLSPDGGRVAVAVVDAEVGGADLWVLDLARPGSRSRITFGGVNQFFPVWSPDGARLAFTRLGDENTLRIATTDGTDETEILNFDQAIFPTSWTPDGQAMALDGRVPGLDRDLWILPFGDRTLVSFLSTPFNERAAVFSPDGRWIAYVSDESGRNEIYVRPYPGPGEEHTVSTEGGTEPVWSPVGGELFFRHEDQVFVVAVDTDESFRAGSPMELFAGRYDRDNSAAAGVPNYDVGRDGRRLLMIRRESQSAGNASEVTVVLNWFEELKRLVPVN